MEFIPIDNINQVVGHTRLEKPMKKVGNNSENWNFDTDSKYIALWDNGVVSFIENKWL
jgi:hypothetical protein